MLSVMSSADGYFQVLNIVTRNAVYDAVSLHQYDVTSIPDIAAMEYEQLESTRYVAQR